TLFPYPTLFRSLLADVLAKAVPTLSSPSTGHVAFSCTQTLVQDDAYYGGSIDLARCLDASKSIILALELNGRPLSVEHGAPVRMVLPGVAGARWGKWLDRSTVRPQESNNYYMQQDYKILPDHVRTKADAMRNWHLVPPMQLMPINSIVGVPQSGETIVPDAHGKVLVAGYAVPQGGDGPVTKVEVSLDRGKSWEETAIVQETPTQWSWALWSIKVDASRLLAEGSDDADADESSKRIWCRAWDKGGNKQEGMGSWNWRGVGFNGY